MKVFMNVKMKQEHEEAENINRFKRTAVVKGLG